MICVKGLCHKGTGNGLAQIMVVTKYVQSHRLNRWRNFRGANTRIEVMINQVNDISDALFSVKHQRFWFLCWGYCWWDIKWSMLHWSPLLRPLGQYPIIWFKSLGHFNVPGPSYPGLTRSWSWLLMPWRLASPGHQQPWYWLCNLGRPLSYTRKDSIHLCQVSVGEG